MNTYTITLGDGSQIANLQLNGNNFISQTKITEDTFTDLSKVVISDGEIEEVHENMALVQITENNGEYWFILRDLSREELLAIEMQGNIDYIAMMTDVEL